MNIKYITQLKSLGITMTQVEISTARRKFADQLNRAQARGIKFKFTFPEWLKWWIDSGYWEQRGNLKHQYCMSRFNDTGDYEHSNVFVQTNFNNCRQANLGKILTSEHKAKLGKSGPENGFYGKHHTPESTARRLASRKANKLIKE